MNFSKEFRRAQRGVRHYLNANPVAVDILRVLSKHDEVWFTTGQISYALHNAEPGRVGAYLKKLSDDGLILAGYRETDCHIHKRIRVWKMGVYRTDAVYQYLDALVWLVTVLLEKGRVCRSSYMPEFFGRESDHMTNWQERPPVFGNGWER